MVILRQQASEGLIGSDPVLSSLPAGERNLPRVSTTRESCHKTVSPLQLRSLYKQHLRHTSKRKPKLSGLFKDKDLKACKKKKKTFPDHSKYPQSK